MKIALTVDFEDWYQGIDIPVDRWNNLESRIHIGHERLLTMFQRHHIKATYFLLGKVIEEHPDLVQQIIAEGHEIGSHTYSHPFIYKISPDNFREEIRKSKQLIQQLGVEFTGFRAPYFSIDKRCLWALDILKEEGFLYDSSIFAGDSKRTGIPGFDPSLHPLENGLVEFPVSTMDVFGFDFGVGGGYFRLLPYGFFKEKIGAILKNRHCIFYLHPWELDVKQPKVKGISKRIQFTHYVNLYSMEEKLNRLMGDFECTSITNILNIQHT